MVFDIPKMVFEPNIALSRGAAELLKDSLLLCIEFDLSGKMKFLATDLIKKMWAPETSWPQIQL
jgi:hypothetical protein